MSENTIIVSNDTTNALNIVGLRGEGYERIIQRILKDYSDKLEGRKIVYKELGYMITFEDESGLVMIRDLDGEPISLRSMLKLVDLVLVVEHNESKAKKMKKEPAYNPDLFVRNPTPKPDMNAEDRLAPLEIRRAMVKDRICWLLTENKDYKKIKNDLPGLKKELVEIDSELNRTK